MAIKTRRGVYIKLEDSDITLEYMGKVYKFTSVKKREIFLKRVVENINALHKLNGKIYRYTSPTKKCYNLKTLCDNVYDKVYKTMIYK